MTLLLTNCAALSRSTGLSEKSREQDIEPEDLKSPNASSVIGISVPNAHVVSRTNTGEPLLLRSQAPKTDAQYDELQNFGITDVLIFKNQTRKEVDSEIEHLTKIGIPRDRISHIPFPYKNFPDFKSPCQQTVQSLKTIQRIRSRNDRKLLFHCTVGEDRTGYLAGLVRLLDTKDLTLREVFHNEMCAHGYSSGNTSKPKSVTNEIDQDLTPVFLKMAYLVKNGHVSWNHLDVKVCDSDPALDSKFQSSRDFSDAMQYRCN